LNQITYQADRRISVEQFIDLLQRSTLAERRPVNDKVKVEKMLTHGNILVTAWHNDLLIGVSRALSDFSFCCYLSDLAVDQAYQHKGIGKELIRLTHQEAGESSTTLILIAAPKAAEYYPKIGMDRFTDCFIIKRKK